MGVVGVSMFTNDGYPEYALKCYQTLTEEQT